MDYTWALDLDTPLPTISGLDVGTVKPYTTPSGSNNSSTNSTGPDNGGSGPNNSTDGFGSGLTTGEKAGIGIGVAALVAGAVVAGVWVMRRRRRQHFAAPDASATGQDFAFKPELAAEPVPLQESKPDGIINRELVEIGGDTAPTVFELSGSVPESPQQHSLHS